MGKRTNTAVWLEKYQRWQINVQKDGKRKTFSSSVPGRKGQIACNQAADEWLEENIVDGNMRVSVLFDAYLERLKETTSRSNWHPAESQGRNWIKPVIGNKKISKLTENDLQEVIDKAYQKKKLAKKHCLI